MLSALIGSATVGAGTRTWAPKACAGPPTDRKAAARELTPATPSDLAAAPWFRLDPVAADDGSLGGERLVLGRFGDPLTRTLDLPVESFAAGPFGRTVLTGADDGAASRLGLVDVAGGCSWLVATERDVIRRATIDPAGGADLRDACRSSHPRRPRDLAPPLDGAAPAERILDPIGADVRFGITFSTEFTWDLAGDRLAVQSCGEFACRTRLLDPRGGPVPMLDAPDLGLLVGVDGDRVVTYGDCQGCPARSSRPTSRPARERSSPTRPAPRPLSRAGRPGLVHETATAGTALRSVAARWQRCGRPRPDDRWARADRDAAVPAPATRDCRAGWVAPRPGWPAVRRPDRRRPQLRHVPDGATVPLDEATR